MSVKDELWRRKVYETLNFETLLLVGPPRFELEPFCGRERSESPQAKSRAVARGRTWWAHQDLNLEPTDYESAALTVELWARWVLSAF